MHHVRHHGLVSLGSPLRLEHRKELHLQHFSRNPGAEHSRHHHRRRLGGRDADAGTSQAEGCCRNRERGHASGFPADRFLHVPFSHSLGRLAPECRRRVVVGRFSSGAGDGPDHRQGRRGRTPGEGVLRRLRVPLKLFTHRVAGKPLTLPEPSIKGRDGPKLAVPVTRGTPPKRDIQSESAALAKNA
jgi:hypothetical protein